MCPRTLARLALLALALTVAPLAARAQGEPEPAVEPASEQATEEQAADDPLAAEPGEGEGFPVTLDGEVLFHVRNPLGPFSAEERAAQSEKTVLRIARDPFYSPELLRIEEDGEDVVVRYRGSQIGALSAKEAAEYGTTARAMAEDVIQVVKIAIAEYRERQKPEAWLKGAGITLGALLLLIALIRLVARAHTRLTERVREQGGWAIGRLFKHHRSLPEEKLLEIELRLLGWARTALIVLLVLVFLEVAFLALPFTRGLARGLLHYVLDPLVTLRDQLVTHIGDLFFIVVIIAVARVVMRLLHWVAKEAQAGTIHVPTVTRATAIPAYKVVRMVLIAVTGMMIYPYIPGSSSAAFKGVGLFAGALFTLGASGTASSLIGGVTLIFTDVYRVGDRIQVGDVVGDVVEVTLLITRLRSPKNEIVTLSNGGILAAKIVNYSREARRRGLVLHTTVTIGYDVPWRKVHELLTGAAKATEGIQETPEPFVLQTSLNDFYVSYELNAYTKDASAMPATYGALHQSIQDAFAEAGVEIMSPHYAAHRDGGTPTLPEGSTPEGAPQPFVVRVEGQPGA